MKKEITQDQARECLKKYFIQRAEEMVAELEIKNSTTAAIYSPKGECYFVDVPDVPDIGRIGGGRVIGISKVTGEIIIDGFYGE